MGMVYSKIAILKICIRIVMRRDYIALLKMKYINSRCWYCSHTVEDRVGINLIVGLGDQGWVVKWINMLCSGTVL